MSLSISRVLWLTTVIVVVNSQDDFLDVSTDPPVGSCQPITEITMCLDITWNNASFPNLRQNSNQQEANTEIQGFFTLVQQTQCSNAIVHFLCSVYAPFCDYFDGVKTPITLKPCREVCMHVRERCEPFFVVNGFEWPKHLECDNFPSNTSTNFDDLCLNINVSDVQIPPNLLGTSTTKPTSSTTGSETTSASTATPDTDNPTPDSNDTTTPRPTPGGTTTQPISQLNCPDSLTIEPGHTLANASYMFAEIEDCAVICEGVYFSDTESNKVAPAFILICAIVCIAFTVFTVGTFLIDRQRYHYPERPVIFLALCYLILSVAFVVGTIVKLDNPSGSYACSDTSDDQNSFVFQRLPDAIPTYRSASCVILFIFVYYFQMAAAIWWVVLTLTWFLASTLKWGEEAVERPWILYHIFAWCPPAIQVILILALQLVDGDQLSGICFTGNHHNVGLGVFVLMPLIIYLVLGIVFFLVGFSSLVHILLQISKDPHKSRRLTRLIIRISVYSLLYIIPNVIYICLCIYELAEKKEWEKSYTECHNKDCSLSSSPQFAALLIRYLMLFIIGIFSTFWVISLKTIVAWKKFFTSIFCCRQEQKYTFPEKRKETAI